ncbi:Similar to DnaJ homolog 1, mitochondrial; acc. no. P87239 [Pyronema omphalodes CBS 100304]|nr:Similar to DnaJ homolog 1, mitochondrial; acc. no. P87239 [Pyronema omphalodes CBS 100304]
MPTLDEDPYQVLSLSHSASRSQIRRKYFTLARMYHPDKVPEHRRQQSEEQFKRFKQAYECLMDPVRKSGVDAERQRRDKAASDAAQELSKRQREEKERLAKERSMQEREAKARRQREEAAAEAERQAEWLRQQAARARGPARPAASNYGTAGDSPPPYTAPPSYTSSPPRTSNIPKQATYNPRTYTYSYTADIRSSERTYLFSTSGRRTQRTRRSRRSSTAYHLSQSGSFFSPHIPHTITLFDSSSLLGGRSAGSIPLGSSKIPLGPTTIPLSSSLLPIARRLGIPTTPIHDGIGDLIGYGTGSFGVWDGRSWAYVEAAPKNFLDRAWWNIGLWLRYGAANDNTQREMIDFRERRKGIRVPFKNLGEALQKTALQGHTEQSAENWLEERGIGEGYRREVLNAWVRARYSQNLGTITAFGALLAADHAHSVGVDVAALWAAMAEKSGATLRLGAEVQGIERGSWGGWYVNSTSSPLLEMYDTVVIATPWGLSPLTQSLEQQLQPEDIPRNVSYVDQHITLFVSTAKISNDEFGGVDTVPGLILTTPCSWEYRNISGYTGRDGLGQPPFWVLSRIGESYGDMGKREYVYKVLSADKISDDLIQRWLGRGKDFVVVWRGYEKAAHSLLLPNQESAFSKIQLDQGLWYTGSIEEAATGIDMGAVMGENVAALIVDQWGKEGKYLSEDRRRPIDEE